MQIIYIPSPLIQPLYLLCHAIMRVCTPTPHLLAASFPSLLEERMQTIPDCCPILFRVDREIGNIGVSAGGIETPAFEEMNSFSFILEERILKYPTVALDKDLVLRQ